MNMSNNTLIDQWCPFMLVSPFAFRGSIWSHAAKQLAQEAS